MLYIFWILFFLIVYTYFIYPLILRVIIIFLSDKKTNNIDINFTIDFVILAYNEEKVIESKILNSIEATKNIKNSKIIIVSDGSTDRTNKIVKKYLKNSKIKLYEFKRLGKSQAINKIIPKLNSEIVVFSDANIEYTNFTISNLIKPFINEKVGCTCGKLVFRNPGNIISGKGESMYWKYENTLKKLESRIGYVSGATGAVYAIRRNLFKQLPNNCINDDFTISMKIIEKGFKCIYTENAIVYENVAPSVKSEFKRHIRDATGHYISIIHLYKLINPFLGLRSFIFWSHRLLRWSVPFFMIFIFISNIFLLNLDFYFSIFLTQISFYFLALVGLIFHNKKKLSFVFYVPFYFTNLNFSLLVGFFNSLFYKQSGMWNSTQR